MTATHVGAMTASVYFHAGSTSPELPHDEVVAALGAADRRIAHGAVRPQEDAIAECAEGFRLRMAEFAGAAEPGARG